MNNQHIIEDPHTGYSVCTHCGLELEPIYLFPNYPHNDKFISSYEYSNEQEGENKIKTSKEEVFISDVCENMLLTKNIICLSIDCLKNISKLITKKYCMKDLASYAIYATVKKHCKVKIKDEVVAFTGTSAKKISAIEENLKQKNHTVCNNPSVMVNKYCRKLNLNFEAIKEIEQFVSYWHDKCFTKSLSLVASAIYLYCVRHNIDISLKKIARTCWISPPSIYRFTKKYLSTVDM